ncbi:hypothetical protein KY339_00090, partial [Candidatus Woesearchaeota archaeon]|nr:hypothetical protein [Candidatus Woesearchaeota archaeon]
SKWISKNLSVDKKIIKPIMIIVLCLLLIAPFKSAKVTAINEVPSFDDGWYNTLTKIKDNSEENAIINSWWDFGHWFKAMADRAVTFDGGSQNNPQAHWIGNVLLTSNEDEAIGILRMMDCGADTAFDELNEEIDDTVETVDILYEIIILDEKQAKEVLTEYVPEEKADSILEKTHCQPPEDFFITSEDMVGKAGVWAHFGGWDFVRSEIWVKVKKMPFEQAVQFMVDKYDFSEEEAEKIYYEVSTLQGGRDANTWISPWPSYYSGLANCKKISDTTIQCDVGVQGQLIPIKVDLRTADASIEAQQGTFHPESIVWTDTEGFQERVYEENTLPYSMALIMESENNYKAILMAPELAKSMFTRLFYYKGYGLKHFDPFGSERSINGWNIYTWKIDWEGREIPLGMEEQEEIEESEEVLEEEIIEVSGEEETVSENENSS